MKTFLPERSAVFVARFSRCYELLYFMACRVLGDSEGAEEVIEDCRLRASQNPADFALEGAFRNWLVRILMDEALSARGIGNLSVFERAKNP